MHSNSTLRAMATMATALSAQEIVLSQTVQYDVSYLNGGYAYSISGSAMDPITGSTTRIAEAGRLAADGAGGVAGATARRTFAGTYTINPDGTGALVLN